jgi:hypothetical protein
LLALATRAEQRQRKRRTQPTANRSSCWHRFPKRGDGFSRSASSVNL